MKKHLPSLAFLTTLSFALITSMQAADPKNLPVEDPQTIYDRNAALIAARDDRNAQELEKRSTRANEAKQQAKREAIQRELDRILDEHEAQFPSKSN